MLNVTNPNIGIDFQNNTYITGTVAFNKNVIVKGDNILTGSYNSETDEFSIYINEQLFAKLQNMSHWGWKISITGFNSISHVEYPPDYYEGNNNPELNTPGLGGYIFCDNFGLSELPVKAEIYWASGTPNSFIEFLLGDTYSDKPCLIGYSNVTDAYKYTYFCEQQEFKFGIVSDVLCATHKQSPSFRRDILFNLIGFLDDIEHSNDN